MRATGSKSSRESAAAGSRSLWTRSSKGFGGPGSARSKINFEDRGTFRLIPDADALEERVCGELGDEKPYVFLDEVQVLKDWNAACRSLRLKNLSLFVTGSNSQLLSREFPRELSGRYAPFRARPFVYRELQEYARELGREYSVSDYLVYGGFPKIAEYPGKAERLHYLNDLDATIVSNDIMNRYGIRKTEIFRRLVNFALLSNARIFSASSVQKSLKGDGFSCSLATVMKYLSYLGGSACRFFHPSVFRQGEEGAEVLPEAL